MPVFFASKGVMSGNSRKGSVEPFARFQDAGTSESTAGGQAGAVGVSGDVRDVRHRSSLFRRERIENGIVLVNPHCDLLRGLLHP